MAELAEHANSSVAKQGSVWGELLRREDWWAIWIGLALVGVATALFVMGGSIKWVAVAPLKWSELDEVRAQLARHGLQFAALFVLWAAALGAGVAGLGISFARFLPAFLVLFLASGAIYFLGLWDQAPRYSLEPPLVGLGLGLLVSNTFGAPRWLQPALRVEFYIKTGIVLLGASLPLTLIAWAGPTAIVQAAVVSLATFATIYFAAVKMGLDKRLAATLGTGGAVCGVSGAIAVGGAVGAKKDQVSVVISLVVLWAIAMIFVLPLAARGLGLSTGVAGAWIGTSEFADAAGLAAAQTYAAYAGHVPGIAGTPDAAVTSFTLMKVIGRDMWIGVWALVLSLVATTRWETTGVENRIGAGEVWRRFPKFVLGFLIASAAVTFVSQGHDYAAYKKEVLPALVAPLQTFRIWAFTFAFLSIGLTTRIREFASFGARPFYAFAIGVVVNVVLGFVLSTRVFNAFWDRLSP